MRRTKAQIDKDIELQTKVCSACSERLPFNDFHPTSSRRDGRYNKCRSCTIEHQTKYNRSVGLMRRYGITQEDVDKLREEQDYRCKICGVHEDDSHLGARTNGLCVDHDHITGKIRGLLCHKCNMALGLFEDSKESLKRAIDYLCLNLRKKRSDL